MSHFLETSLTVCIRPCHIMKKSIENKLNNEANFFSSYRFNNSINELRAKLVIYNFSLVIPKKKQYSLQCVKPFIFTNLFSHFEHKMNEHGEPT